MGENFLNLSNSEIDEKCFQLIVSILEEYGNLEINKLISHLLTKTKNTKNSKYKNVLTYFKVNHSGIVRFLEKYFAFTIVRGEKTINILLNKENIHLKPFINDWVFIDDDYCENL
tara:strand:+ start:1596 stop:1940 length:345 start_codon:yes stop_codon:yes gene_type:complete